MAPVLQTRGPLSPRPRARPASCTARADHVAPNEIQIRETLRSDLCSHTD